MNNWYQRDQLTLISAIPRQMVLGYMQKQTEKAERHKKVSSICLWPLFQVLSLGDGIEILPWILSGIEWPLSCKLTQTLPSLSCLWPCWLITTIGTITKTLDLTEPFIHCKREMDFPMQQDWKHYPQDRWLMELEERAPRGSQENDGGSCQVVCGLGQIGNRRLMSRRCLSTLLV